MSEQEPIRFNFANALVKPWSGGVDLYLADKHPGRLVVISTLVCTVHDPAEGLMVDPKPITLDHNSAVMLAEALWAAGIRPKKGTADHEATSAHLKDMRRLAFETLGIQEP